MLLLLPVVVRRRRRRRHRQRSRRTRHWTHVHAHAPLCHHAVVHCGTSSWSGCAGPCLDHGRVLYHGHAHPLWSPDHLLAC